VDTFDATMEVACRALQWWSRELVHVNTYLTTQDTTCFDLHWDDHDVVILQLAGDKDWEVRDRSRPVPMYRDAAPNNTPSEEVIWSGTLVTGDVVHIPRGYWHQATRIGRGEGFSLHVTFGFTRRTGVD
jgi:ribosomal protein L16 Arg81 hydroxylase